MARPISFPEADDVADFEPPKRSRPLPIKTVGDRNISCWKLDADELELIQSSKCVWVDNQSFYELLPHPNGELWQPSLRVLVDKTAALSRPPSPNKNAPASDRLVTYDDNRRGFDEVRNALASIDEELRRNSFDGLSSDEIEYARREVLILQHAWECEIIDTTWLLPATTKYLRWLGAAAINGIIGNLAFGALALSLKYFAG